MPEAQFMSAPIDLTDETFDPSRSKSYHLSLLVEGTNLSYAIFDTVSNKYVCLRTGAEPPQLNFKSATCAVAHPKFTLVPDALFDDESKESLLGFNHPVEAGEKIHSDVLHSLDARNLFTISRDLETKLRAQYPNIHFLHNATAFIEGLLMSNKNRSGKTVFANFHPTYFEIVILENGELLFGNAFEYKTSEEIAYYMLFVYEQLRLNPEEVELILSGEIEKTAKEHSLLYTYIRHVKFAGLPDSLQYSYKFDDIQAHRFFSLLNQFLVTN